MKAKLLFMDMKFPNSFQESQVSDLIILVVAICFAIVFIILAHVKLLWSWVIVNIMYDSVLFWSYCFNLTFILPSSVISLDKYTIY